MLDPAQAPDALAQLAEAGAHFVLCRTTGDIDNRKRAKATAYQKNRPPLAAAQRHRDNGYLVGVIPASIGCVVIDIDRGGTEATDAVVELLGQPVARHPTRRPGGEHLWFRSREAETVRNGMWLHGDIRGAHGGYAILWAPDRLAEGLSAVRPCADLIAADLARLPTRGGGNVVQLGLPAEGERNNTLFKEVISAAEKGDEAGVKRAKERAVAAGLGAREVEGTAASATNRASTLIGNPYSSDGLAEALRTIGVGVRLNVRAKRYEYHITGAWIVADDERDSWVRQEIARHCTARKGSTSQRLKYATETYLDLRRALGNNLRIDPFIVFLKGLPEWDGQPRIDSLLTNMFGAGDDELSKWASRYIGLAAIQRAAEPGSKIDEVPVLLGEQGCGKSHFVRAWFDEDQHEWHGDAVDLGAKAKEQAEQMAGRVVCELSELTGIRKAELERLKAFITRQDDGQFRWAYARSPVPSPRMCIFLGTTNQAECLPNDPSGNRRFVVIELQHGCDVEAASADRIQWWSEALSRYRAGERANLPRGLHALAGDRAKEHREPDALEQDIIEALIDLRAEFSVSELYYALPGNGGAKPPDRPMQMRLANALKNLGFRGQRVRQGAIRLMVWSRT